MDFSISQELDYEMDESMLDDSIGDVNYVPENDIELTDETFIELSDDEKGENQNSEESNRTGLGGQRTLSPLIQRSQRMQRRNDEKEQKKNAASVAQEKVNDFF